MILKADEKGQLTLPAELAQVAANAEVEVEREGDTIVLRPAGSGGELPEEKRWVHGVYKGRRVLKRLGPHGEPPLYETATASEGADLWRDWVRESRTEGPSIPLEALRREEIYD